MNYAPYVATYEAFSDLLPQTPATVLDIACGPGNFSRYLLDRNPALKISGVDLAPGMIELARQNVPEGEFSNLDSRKIRTLGRKFDVILLGFCLPYLSQEESGELVADVSRIINENGLLYLSTMEGEYAQSGYQSNDSEDRVFVYYHSLNYLIEKLETNGFEIIHTEKIPFPSEDDSVVNDLFIFARLKESSSA